MTLSQTDLATLAALRAAQRERPELERFLAFYVELYEFLYGAKAGLPRAWLGSLTGRHRRLASGQPLLTFDDLSLTEAEFGPLVQQAGALLERHAGERPVDPAKVDSADTLGLARTIFESWPTLAEPGAGTGELAVAYALAPYLQLAAETLLPGLDPAEWSRPRCPACGGEPNLALLDQERGGRRLVCARCDGAWSHVRVGCPYCASQETQRYYPGADGLYRLYVCPNCGRYLKTVDLRQARRPVNPVVERLLMVGMDLSAREAGLGAQSEAPSS